MSLAVETQIRKFSVTYVDSGVTPLATKTNKASNTLIIPISVLIILQILDFILTLAGVSVFGTNAEGNPLIHWLMINTSNEIGLIIAKSLGLFFIFGLYKISVVNPMPWVPSAVWGANIVYVLGAVIPWSYILISN